MAQQDIPTGSGNPGDILKQLSPEAIGGIVNFAMGSASGVLKGLGLPGANSLPSGSGGGDPMAMLGSTFGSILQPGSKAGGGIEPLMNALQGLTGGMPSLPGMGSGGSVGGGTSSIPGVGGESGGKMDILSGGGLGDMAGGATGMDSMTLGADLDPSHYTKEDGSIDDQKVVETTATVAATTAVTACGIPPPASTMIGKAVGSTVGKAYGEVQEKMDQVNPVKATQKVLDGLEEIAESMGEAMEEPTSGGGMTGGPPASSDSGGSAAMEAASQGAEQAMEAMMEVIDKAIAAVMEGASKAISAADPGGAANLGEAGGNGPMDIGGKGFTPGGDLAMSGPSSFLKPPGGGGPSPPSQDEEESSKKTMSMSKPRPP